MKKLFVISSLVLATACFAPSQHHQASQLQSDTMNTVVIHLDERIRTFEKTSLGINVNFWTDGIHLNQQPTRLGDAVKNLKVRYLRFPGGEKSDGMLWSTPPFEKPRPALARSGKSEAKGDIQRYVEDDYIHFKPDVMDFDEFMALCAETGCEPYVVICYDGMFIPPKTGGTIPTREQLYETACAWVRYANIEKGYNVKYWEIGNESYVISRGGGAKVDDYARDIVYFSEGMKSIDPTIHIFANGPTGLDANETPWGRSDQDTKKHWWATLLPIAAKHIDGIAFHDYPCFDWGSYDYYVAHNVSFADPAVDHLKGLLREYCSPEDALRISLSLTETHSADWSPPATKWSEEATWGHAVVLFDMMASYLRRNEVDAILIWNTRWTSGTKESLAKSGGKYNFWDILDVNNQLLPPGQVIELLNKNLLDGMVRVDAPADLPTFVMTANDGKRVNVFVVNKGYQERDLQVLINGFDGRSVKRQHFQGNGPLDNWARLSQAEDLIVSDGTIRTMLPPVSITLLSIY